MNLRHFSIALLISALPSLSYAEGKISFTKEDFKSAERVTRNGEVIVNVKLSKSGKAKLKKLNKTAVDKEIHSEIGGVTTDFRLREPITGEELQMGPYSEADARKVTTDINTR